MWTDEATAALQDCFECTDWQMFKDAATQGNHIDLEEYTSSVTSFISKCADDVVKIRTVKSFPNEKAWMNGEVRALSRAKRAAFKSNDKEAYSTSRASLRAGIKEAKRRHQQRLERDLNTNNSKTCGRRSKVLQATKAGVLPSCVRPSELDSNCLF